MCTLTFQGCNRQRYAGDPASWPWNEDTNGSSVPGIRLAEKRSLPCPRRNEWYAARDALYEEIMKKSWNPVKKFFAQSYEDQDILDSSLLIMPLVFFSTPVRIQLPRVLVSELRWCML